MARMPRVVVPGYPHHVVQRGVRSIDIFSSDNDRMLYLQFMREEAERFGVQFYAWCLMTNHVHLIAVPDKEESLAKAIGEAHRRYTRRKNFSEGVRGYLFQGRFGSCVLDQQHLLTAGRYVERNPVNAGMVDKVTNYAWSSSRFNSGVIGNDPLVKSRYLPERVDCWNEFLTDSDEELEKVIIKNTQTGRPAGQKEFVKQLEAMTGRVLRAKKSGRPRFDNK